MNYRHIYMCIVMHAKSEQKLGLRKKGNGTYYEAHHILPRSLFPLWIKRKSNIVLLTAREHFFCHQLLTKIWPSKQMTYALFLMVSCKEGTLSSKQYELLRQDYGKAISQRLKGIKKPYLKGKPFGKPSWNKGGKQSKEWILKRMESAKKTKEKHGKYFWSQEQRQKFSLWIENNKELLSDAQKQGWTQDARENFSKIRKQYFEKLNENGISWSEIQKQRCGTKIVRQNMSKARKGKKMYVNLITKEKHFYFEGKQPENYVLVKK